VKRVLAACGLWLVAACLTERPRPAPPALALSLNKTTVKSRSTPAPDTLVVNVRAEDEDGIDSVWVQLAQETPVGADGLLDPVLEGPFRVIVPAGLGNGIVLPVKVQARDVVGFRSERDTSVTVGP
jgi:hypothetical protein